MLQSTPPQRKKAPPQSTPEVDVTSFTPTVFEEAPVTPSPMGAFSLFSQQQLPVLRKWLVNKYPGTFSPREASTFTRVCNKAVLAVWRSITDQQKLPYITAARAQKLSYLSQAVIGRSGHELNVASASSPVDTTIAEKLLGIGTKEPIISSYRYFNSEKRAADKENAQPAKRKKQAHATIGGSHMYAKERSPVVRSTIVQSAFDDGKLMSQAEILRRTMTVVSAEYRNLPDDQRQHYTCKAAAEKAERRLQRTPDMSTGNSKTINEVAYRLLTQLR